MVEADRGQGSHENFPPHVDVVAVTVKVPHHLELVRIAAAAGKHVYCEWPLGNGVAEAEEMTALVAKQGVHGVIGLQARCSPPIGYVRDDVADELRRYLAREHAPGYFVRDGQAFTHLLSTRRMRDLFNSNGRFVRTVRRRTPYNPAFLHPSDAAALGLGKGDRIELESAHGRVTAIIDEDEAVKPGVVSIAHGWGALPGSHEDPAETGTAVNALVDNDHNFEPVNAMPHMSAVPVNIRRLR